MKLSIPMIRKVMPSMIAQQIVGVQPMTGPVGQIFNVRYEAYFRTFNPKYWPHQFTIDANQMFVIERWCYANFRSRYWKRSGTTIVFKRSAEATLFTLKWL